MKSLAELQAIREKMKNSMSMRDENEGGIRVVVGMATCGIAAGARPVLNEFAKLVQEKNLAHRVKVSQTGCIGLCQYEPIVEVFEPGREKVTYIKMDAQKAAEVVERHLQAGHVVEKYTMAKSGLK